MTTTRRIVRRWPSRAAGSRAAGARHARGRALAAALLGAATGFAFGAVILVGAPAVGGASSTAGTRLDGPVAPWSADEAPSVAGVLTPATGGAPPANRDRGEAGP